MKKTICYSVNEGCYANHLHCNFYCTFNWPVQKDKGYVMVVIRNNGQMVVYFDSTNKPKNNNQVLSPEQFDDETEFDDSKFRRWQKNLVKDSQVRARRNGESNFEFAEQKRIRKMMNFE